MRKRHVLCLFAAALFSIAIPALAQSTNGYHKFLVFPVVVESGSFTQQFHFSNPGDEDIALDAFFFGGSASGQGGGVSECTVVQVPAHGTLTVPSLGSLCPNHSLSYGYLELGAFTPSDGQHHDVALVSGFSRVSNPAGIGFAVEAFPAETFSHGKSLVAGAKRLAAGAGSPAYQTNCFVGLMLQGDVGANFVMDDIIVRVRVGQQSWSALASPAPNHIARLLDIFAFVGAPPGDYPDATVEFESVSQLPDRRAGILAFCTVQDNTSFGADFRIAKTMDGALGIASNDGLAAHKFSATTDLSQRSFEIATGNSSNTHLVYFRHPDRVQCRLLDRQSGAPLLLAAGLEMRLLDADGTVIGGGNNLTGTGEVDLGSKLRHGGYNNRYRIEVESNEQNTASIRPYALECQSGSGHTFGYDLVKYQEAVDRF